MTTIFEDINLSDVIFGPDGRSLELRFVDMYGGDPVGRLFCRNICYLRYDNIFEGGDDGFACYVGEVKYTEYLGEEEVGRLKEQVGFRFNRWPINSAPCGEEDEPKFCFLQILGGEVDIEIVCEKIEQE